MNYEKELMKSEVNTKESKVDVTKTAILRSIEAIKQQVLDERVSNEKLRDELATKVAEIATLKANVSRLTEEIQVLDEIKDALSEAQTSLRN